MPDPALVLVSLAEGISMARRWLQGDQNACFGVGQWDESGSGVAYRAFPSLRAKFGTKNASCSLPLSPGFMAVSVAFSF